MAKVAAPIVATPMPLAVALTSDIAKTEHEAEVVNVSNASVFGDVGRESDGQGHGRSNGRCGDLSHPIELTMKDSLH